jgi:hypothetical protein
MTLDGQRQLVRPPPSTCTSIREAPASRAFSTISFTALAGRSTTSPAAMRLTVSGGSRRIGMVLTALAGLYDDSEPVRRTRELQRP